MLLKFGIEEKHHLIILSFCITGPFLPYGLYDSEMVESPDGKGVLVFGGMDKWNGSPVPLHQQKSIFELRAGASSWNILNITLQNKRGYHVVIPLV